MGGNGHSNVGRRVGAEFLNRGENRIDQLARCAPGGGFVLQLVIDHEDAPGQAVDRLVHDMDLPITGWF